MCSTVDRGIVSYKTDALRQTDRARPPISLRLVTDTDRHRPIASTALAQHLEGKNSTYASRE